MNHAKIAAALHALADAFLADAELAEEAVPGKKRKGAAPSAATAAAQAVTAPAPAPAAAAAEPPPAPAPTITKAQLNAAVLKVAAKSREVAEGILARFGAKNTVTLPAEQWQAVYDAFEEEIAKIDAAAVQVAQASLV
jgi:hypothetical protein